MIRIGLDPGLVGACVVVQDDRILGWCRWDLQRRRFSASRGEIMPDWSAMTDLGRAAEVGAAVRRLWFWSSHPPDAFVLVLEAQHVQHGVRSSLSLARYAGALAGPLAARAESVRTPTSREWRLSAGVPIQLPRAAAKSYARGLVLDRWGAELADTLGEDGCEAALMALYEPREKRRRAKKPTVVVTEETGGEAW